MKKFKFFLFLAVVGLFTFDGARGQSVSCVFVLGVPSGTSGGTTPGKQLLCVPSSIIGLIGPPGPVGPQGPPGPAGSGSTFTGGPCTQPSQGVNLYAKLPDGSCLLVVAVPAANFSANGTVHFAPPWIAEGSNGTILPNFVLDRAGAGGFIFYAMRLANLSNVQ